MKKKLVIEIEVEIDLDIYEDVIDFTLNKESVLLDVNDAILEQIHDNLSSLNAEYKQYCEESHAADVATQRAFDKYHNTH